MATSDAPVYIVRKMKKEDISQAVEIWKETGLAEGSHTIDTWYGVDPHGFYVAVNEDSGEIYGVCSAVILNEDLAFLGLYAVRKKCQKRGIGIKIWKAAMEHVAGRNAGLNSVPEHLHTYRDLAGFGVVASWQSTVCESKSIFADKLVHSLKGVVVTKIEDGILPDVIAYDASVQGFDRSKIVTLSVNEEDSITMVARTSSDVICGYGALKKNIQGTVLVGPLYADTREVAEMILWYLIQSFPIAQRDGITLMAIDCNPKALELVKTLGLEIKMYVPRCYTKRLVSANFDKIFGQHALNFSTF